MPIPIRTDVSQAARRLIDEVVNDQADIVVFDFLHATVLMPERMTAATLLFTHNVEAEIFRRHLDVASNPFARALWSNQLRKMEAFEKSSVHRYDGVVAVSERDAEIFSENYGYKGTLIIPTGVDLEFFSYAAPARSDDIVFCGSMDWLANQEAMQFFLDEVWDAIVAECPTARMTVVGRSPPPRLIAAARQRGVEWTFTGFVDDVRPYMQGAAVSVIPLRVGGGTRLKAYESMAMGCPVVSTTVGMEGLPVTPGEHFECADTPREFARAVCRVMQDEIHRSMLSDNARRFVAANGSSQNAADSFADACRATIHRHEYVARPA